jgi:hypothetical protein
MQRTKVHGVHVLLDCDRFLALREPECQRPAYVPRGAACQRSGAGIFSGGPGFRASWLTGLGDHAAVLLRTQEPRVTRCSACDPGLLRSQENGNRMCPFATRIPRVLTATCSNTPSSSRARESILASLSIQAPTFEFMGPRLRGDDEVESKAGTATPLYWHCNTGHLPPSAHALALAA